MAPHHRRHIFLATCLLESIEDENYRNTRKMLVEHYADPNLLIPESNIAAIHYAAGMENTNFAEAAMKLILKHDGNPNVQTIDGDTPLHIAVIWNRTLIVEMLLDHGADYTITDGDGKTAIDLAVSEGHFNLITIFQNHVFEKKLQQKMDNNDRQPDTPPNEIDYKTKLHKNLHRVHNTDVEKILTPNRTNYAFKAASPFLVNINCHRPKHKPTDAIQTDAKPRRAKNLGKEFVTESITPSESKVSSSDEVIVISDSDEGDDQQIVLKNLFELTEENISKHLSMAVKRNRKNSLIRLWRNRVNESRQRKSILPVDEYDLDAFLSEQTKSSSVESSSQSGNTVVPRTPAKCQKATETEDSFFTADDQDLSPESLKNLAVTQNGVVFQTQEVYKHFDPDDNIVFYEKKLLSVPTTKAPQSEVVLNTSSESGTCTDLPVPSDYDTDDLRKELKQFGDSPGPINKNTKRLYLKRLVRYKRCPKQSIIYKNQTVCKFSIELQKTMREDLKSLDFINEYAIFERQMIDGFQSAQSVKNLREGNFKKSFIYLLIDPRVAENLLADSQIMKPTEIWRRFLQSIFYVGKGKSSRPYAHLYDAIKMYNEKGVQNEKMTKYQDNLKLERIIEIWKANKGVICLPVFHNITPVEAYTREAAIIDCLGVENLTNIKRGDYYGISKSWTMRDRKKLGVLLLYKAMHVFMVEGESQLRPNDIK